MWVRRLPLLQVRSFKEGVRRVVMRVGQEAARSGGVGRDKGMKEIKRVYRAICVGFKSGLRSSDLTHEI